MVQAARPATPGPTSQAPLPPDQYDTAATGHRPREEISDVDTEKQIYRENGDRSCDQTGRLIPARRRTVLLG